MGESNANHLTRIAGNCWKRNTKASAWGDGLADAGETRGRMHGNGFVFPVLLFYQAFRFAGQLWGAPYTLCTVLGCVHA